MSRLFVRILLLVLALGILLPAQDQPNSGSSSTTPPPQNDKVKKEKKKKDKEKKKDDKPAQEDALNTDVFSERIANTVLDDIRNGLEGHSQRLMLSAFEGDKMDGYLSFEDQLQAFFARYSGFRAHYRILSATVEGPRGVALVDFELEGISADPGVAPIRRRGQLRIEMERGRKGWKVVDFRPREFFS